VFDKFYRDCQKNVPIEDRFLLQTLMPPSYFRNTIMASCINPNIETRNLDTPEKKKISYHEITKKIMKYFVFFRFRVFVIASIFFAINSNAQNKEITFSSMAYAGAILDI